MTFLRLVYPGAGTERGFSGELSPVAQRVVRKAGVISTDGAGGPVFGRSVYDEPKRSYELFWQVLSHDEARSIYALWEDAGRGALPLYYTPDDGDEPVTVLGPQAPSVAYLTANTASVRWQLTEQR